MWRSSEFHWDEKTEHFLMFYFHSADDVYLREGVAFFPYRTESQAAKSRGAFSVGNFIKKMGIALLTLIFAGKVF